MKKIINQKLHLKKKADKQVKLNSNSEAIDFVIPWVNGADPIWQADKQKYWSIKTGQTPNDGNHDARFRDWNNLQYWFRAVEKFAPWVNRIYFVTYGHIPEWLNLKHPKLVIVRHEDYIPSECLPVFSANPIEINFHRIPGLSENFVYFNDDMFLTAPVQPSDFFVNGKPREMANLYPLTNDGNNDSFVHMLLTMTGIINANFSKKVAIRKNWRKWFTPKYGKSLLGNILMLRYHNVSGLLATHVPSSMKKSTMEEVWDKCEEVLLETSKHRFRTNDDVTQYLFRYWTIMKGEFEPTNIYKYSREFFILDENINPLVCAIKNMSYKLICINDSVQLEEFERVRDRIVSAFDAILPEKSSFEI